MRWLLAAVVQQFPHFNNFPTNSTYLLLRRKTFLCARHREHDNNIQNIKLLEITQNRDTYNSRVLHRDQIFINLRYGQLQKGRPFELMGPRWRLNVDWCSFYWLLLLLLSRSISYLGSECYRGILFILRDSHLSLEWGHLTADAIKR